MRLAAILVFLFLGQAHAATFSVTNTADSGPGSLRQAVLDASSDNTFPRVIRFDAPFPQGGTIELLTTLPTWSNNILTIDGNGREPVLDGRNAVRILTVAAGTREITLRGLTFRRGRSAAGVGGCLWYSGAPAETHLSVYDSRFEGCRVVANQLNAHGGAIGWVSPDSWVFIRDSVFTDNAGGVIGGSELREMFGGALMVAGARIEITSSRFVDNAMQRVSGMTQGFAGAAYLSASQSVFIRDVEFEGNAVIDANSGPVSAGGAMLLVCTEANCPMTVSGVSFIDNQVSASNAGGGALIVVDGALSLLNTSFSGNQVDNGTAGALLMIGGTLDGRHVSFKDNQAAFAAHIGLSNVGVTRWVWSLVGPAAPGSGTFCGSSNSFASGPLVANLFEHECDILSASGAVVGPVGPLALDRAVYPATLAPGSGSPAIDFPGPQGQCLNTFDARGVARPQDGDGDGLLYCDVGAYEVLGAWLFSDGFEAVP